MNAKRLTRFLVILLLSAAIRSAEGASFEEALRSLDSLAAESRRVRLVTEASREGRVRWSTSTNLDRVQSLLEAWKKKYPDIQLEYHRLSGRKLADRAIHEYRAGRYEFDLIGSSAVTFVSLKDAGVIRPYVSPEAARIRSRMRDPNGFWTSEYSNVLAITCNRNRIKVAPGNWKDFTDPKWKGDFSIDTERFQWFRGLQKLNGEEGAKSLITGLVGNRALIRRGGTLQAQLVAAGEYSCTLGAYLNSAYLLTRRGAPLVYAVPEPVLLSPTITTMARVPPHPYAAILLYDWLLSPEGLSHFTRNNALFPSRTDVPMVEEIKALQARPLHFIDVEDQGLHYKETSETYESLLRK
ncbi:MAG: extracellular solute-binding protein [Deltaproteobacteria bacterium]|nr:extracellular solute-binding protein [Deltaproteobacteria bacterium]